MIKAVFASEAATTPSDDAVAMVVAPEAQAEAERLLRAAFEGADDPVTLMRRLETAIDAGRDAWPLATIRSLWDVLWTLEAKRERSPNH